MSTLLSVRMVNVSGRFNLQPSFAWLRLRYVGGLHEDMACNCGMQFDGNALPARIAGEYIDIEATQKKQRGNDNERS